MPFSLFTSYPQQLKHPDTLAYRLTLLAIIALGFLLRLSGVLIGEGYHYSAINDELSAYQSALALLAGETPAWYLGQPTFAGGQAPGPWWTVFWSLGYLLGGKTPQGVMIVMAIINSIAIYIVYRFARQLFAPRAALLGTVLFASAPWAVYYAVGAWNPMPLALLGTVLFLSLWKVTQTDHSPHIVWVCVVAALIPQFHMIGLFYLPAIAVVLYLCPATLNKRAFLFGVLAGIGLYLPYLIGDGLNGWQNTLAILHGDKQPFSLSVFKILTIPATVMSNFPSRWAGEGKAEFILLGNALFGHHYLLLLINLITFLVALVILGWLLGSNVNRLRQANWSWRRYYHANPTQAFFIILLVLPLLLFVASGRNYSSRYMIIVFPLVFLLPVLFLDTLRDGAQRFMLKRYLPIVTVVNLYLVLGYHWHMQHQIANGQVFMPSFNKLEALYQVLDNHAGANHRIEINVDALLQEYDTYDYIIATAIRDYLHIQQTYLTPRQHQVVAHYQLRKSSDTNSRVAIAYRRHGIEVIRQQ